MRQEYHTTDSADLPRIAEKLIRVVDWKWMMGVIGSVIVAGALSYSNYVGMVRTVSDQTAGITRLTAKLDTITDQLNASHEASMKMGFDITRLTDRITAMEAKQNATAAVAAARK